MISFLVLALSRRPKMLISRIELEEREALGRDHGERARTIGEMTVPDVEEFRQVVDVGKIDLRLDRVAQRRAAGLERGLEPRGDKKLGLQPDIGAVPHGVGRAIGRLGEFGHLLVVRHLSGDEHVVARHQRRDEAGVLRHRYALGLRGSRLAAAARQHRNHGYVHVGACHQELLHEHGGAGWDEFLEHGLARALIGIHDLRAGVILVDPHDVAKIAALGRDQSSEAIDDEVALAAIARRAAERAPGLARDLGGETVREIARHVAGEEQPRAGAHALGKLDIRVAYRRRRDELHIDHFCLHCTRCRSGTARPREPPRRKKRHSPPKSVH